MTTQIAGPTDVRTAPNGAGGTGTVFDIGYQRYTGAREGRGRARRAVYTDGLRAALGLGRGAWSKVLPWFFIGLLAGIALIMALIAGAAERMAGPGAAERMNLPSHSDYNGFASIILFLFAALVGPELLCRDRREGVLNLYFVRPLTSGDYVAARWLAFLVVMLVAAWLPQIILLLGLSMGDPTPVAYLRKNWLDIPRFLAAGLVMAAYITTLAMLTASFTTRRAYAAVFLVGLFAITTPFTMGLAAEIGGRTGQVISLFSLTNIPLYVNDIIFGEVSEVTSIAPARTLPKPMLVGWWFAWTVIPGVILWWRYRRLTP
ncbi:MAG TPA: ABC transporter permease subunit [Gemmatimonadaceae bacterium]|nr:ABC transporter permease subunit [Gemmatimonadaceae bacterium]